ncbi:MAG: hypothetical protein JWN99_633 [Ilumatobacteraceae bacterium]|nr:hypothetical protein [Ilumatobacteraceae bacterium]
MSHDEQHDAGAVSRRGLIGAAAALGAGAVVALGATPVSARPIGVPRPEVLGTMNSALTYLPIDGLAFFTYSTAGNDTRIYQDATGVQPATFNTRIATSLPLPVGSVIRQLNIAYQGQPIVEITRRDMVAPNPPTMQIQQSLAAGGGAKTQTLDLTTAIVIEPGGTYSLQFFCTAGSSVLGVTIGYQPPTQGFQPFIGADPRALNTRNTGGKLTANEERIIPLGFAGARGAVLNVTVADTEGAGFIAVNRAGIAWPGNSSLNWNATGQLLSNGVTTALDENGSIVIRGGVNSTHVIVDRIGWLI